MLQFDEATARQLDETYHGSDFTRRRRANFDALAPMPGETVVDLGCGNGLLTAELSRAVGREGAVIGIDPAEPMLASARDRCRGRQNIRFDTGTAEALPLDDAAADGVISVRVFEYIADLVPALAEVRRVLRPGGRVVIGDMHFGTWVWRSDAPDRMDRMMRSWDRHLAHTGVPELLPGTLAAAGLRLERVVPVPFTDTVLRPDSLARMTMTLMQRFAVQNGHASAAEEEDWAAEQVALSQDGQFFFSLTHFVTVARRD